HTPFLAVVYILTYGGGIVSGDRICVEVETQQNINLMLLTQGSTKIYKQKRQEYTKNQEINCPLGTQQRLNAYIQKNSMLLQLPEPTTCFRAADYSQRQIFSLEDETSSVVVLDWFTSGRMSRGERWEFSRYESGVDLLVGEKLIFRDVILLKNETDLGDHVPLTEEKEKQVSGMNDIHRRLEPYECFATLVIYGPRMIPITNRVLNEYEKIVIGKMNEVIDLTWSSSALYMEKKVNGVVIKVAGVTTEMVRNFLIKVALKGLNEIVGENLFERAL
ncbi:2499_t:CDS:1, partial [Acaulospora morrowiae]